MKFLNRLFSTPKDFAVDEDINEKAITKNLAEYYKTIPEKEQIINQLPYSFGEKRANLQRLKQLLDLELVDINLLEKEEKDIVSDLKALEHAKRIKRVIHLEETLAYAETKYKYSWELMRNLYATLVIEKQIIEELIKADLRKYRKLIDSLKSELLIEKTIVEKLKERKTFPKLFLDLINGEQIIYKLDKKEQRLIKTFKNGAPMEGITDKLVTTIFDSMEDRIHELVAEDALNQGYYRDLEFVNSPEFTDLVRQVIKYLRPGKKLSEPTINAFVHLFREKYNDENDY